MSVSGRIAIDVEFTDRTSVDGAQSLRTIALRDANEYATGKVAIVTGTVGTASQTISLSGIRDASGQEVTFSSVTRVAMQTSGLQVRYLMSSFPEVIALAASDEMAIGNVLPAFPSLVNHRLRTTAGTASYTLVLYGT
jgi:hypothetical protein